MVQSPCQGAGPQGRGYLCGREGGSINPAGERQSFCKGNRRAALREKEQSEAQSPPRGGRRRSRGGTDKRAEGCAAEALPAAETAEAEQGQPSKYASRPRPAPHIWLTATRRV